MKETLNVIELKELHLNLKRRFDKIYKVDLNSSALAITTSSENFKNNLQDDQLSSKAQMCAGKIVYTLVYHNF